MMLSFFNQELTYEDAEKLQKDLSSLNEWSTEWSMLFNAEKCKLWIQMTILWEMNALKQHTRRERLRSHHHRNTGCNKTMCQGSY